MNTQQLVVDFIPILLVYVFASYPKDAILFSGSSSGKLIAICIIYFYTSVKPIYGAFVCILLLVYYQTDFVEETLNIERGEWIEMRLLEMNSEFSKNYGDPLWGNANGKTTIADIEVPKDTDLLSQSNNLEKMTEGFRLNDPDLYSYIPLRSYRSIAEDLIDKKDRKSELMEIFRKENCVNEKLMHKGLEVNPEMADHIFREIKHDNEFNKCNPCVSSCSFSIIEEKLRVETKLQSPVRSNDIFETYSKSIHELFTNTTNTVSGYIPNMNNFTSFLS